VYNVTFSLILYLCRSQNQLNAFACIFKKWIQNEFARDKQLGLKGLTLKCMDTNKKSNKRKDLVKIVSIELTRLNQLIEQRSKDTDNGLLDYWHSVNQTDTAFLPYMDL